MIHTFEIGHYITNKAAQAILSYRDVKQTKRGFHFAGAVNGITKVSLYRIGRDEENLRGTWYIKIIVNPDRLMKGYEGFRTVLADAETLERLTHHFNTALIEAIGGRSSYGLPELPEWKVRRIDYALDIHTPFVEQYVLLFAKGDKAKYYRDNPKGWTGSCYWECNSVIVNLYWKVDELVKKNAHPTIIARAKDILRFEIQCKGPKLSALRKKGNLRSSILRNFFNSEIAEEILLSYCKRSFKEGDYYTFGKAEKQMEQRGSSKRKIKALSNILKAIAQTRSISAARKQLSTGGIVLKNTSIKIPYSTTQFGRNLKALVDLEINPVTIPRDWKIECLPSVYSMIEQAFHGQRDNDACVLSKKSR